MFFRASPYGRRNARRAVFGSLLCVVGFVAGGLIGVGKLHRSLVVDSPIESMSCLQLVKGGATSPMVRLVDATVHVPPELSESIADADSSATMAKVRTVLSHPQAKPLVDQLVRGHITPTGMVRNDGPRFLQLGYGRDLAKTAQTLARNDGQLLVHASCDSTANILVTAASWLNLEMPESIQQASELPMHTLHPASTIEPLRVAASWFGGGLIALSLGLVLCGSAGLGRWALLCPTGAVLGLIGMPLRCGRGNRWTQFLALLTGFSLFAAAYYLAVQQGGLLGRWSVGPSVWWMQLAGFVSAAVGLAAIMGAAANARSKRRSLIPHDITPSVTKERSRTSSKKAAARMKIAEEAPSTPLISLKPATTFTRRYMDPRLSVSPAMTPSEEVAKHTDLLQKHDFEEPLLVEISRNGMACDATVQVGCRQLVLAMTDKVGNEMRWRMVSVLDNGHVVTTVSNGYDSLPESRQHDAATLQVVDVSKISKLLSKHLEAAANVAEEQKVQMVALESAEWRDIVHYSERCLADMMHHCGDEKWEILDSQFGRFAYPMQPVPSVVPA